MHNSRRFAALLSSLVSQLILLLLLLIPSSHPFSILNSPSPPTSFHTLCQNLFPLLHHFLSISETATILSLFPIPRKRKRTRHAEPGDDSDEDRHDNSGSGLGRLARVYSFISRNPDSFRSFFKMTSSTFEWLSGLLEPLLDCRDPVESPLNLFADTRLGIGLFRLATGADYPEISRRFGVSEPTSKFCVKQLCRVLCTNFRFWVGFPSPNELETVSTQFQSLYGLPNCCGIIDCTRFRILRTSGDKPREETIAAQLVVDSSSRILSIIAGFQGNKDNSRVLKSSSLYKDMERGLLLNSQTLVIDGVTIAQYLVGDGGYPLLPWLIVPFVDPVMGSCQDNFNAAHRLMRLPVLKTIASLKNWGVLSKPMEVEFKTAVAYIGACSILHNVLLMREDCTALFDGSLDCALLDRNSYYCKDASLVKNSIEEKASRIRNALAIRAVAN